MPVVVSGKGHPLIGSVRSVHASAETISAGKEHIVLSDIDDVHLRGVIRQLVFAQDGREQTDGTYSVGASVRHIRRNTGTVAEACNRTGRDIIGSIYHVNEVADGIFEFMLTTQFAIMGHTFPEVTVINRTLLEGPFIDIRHDKYHRFTTAGSDKGFERVDGIAFVLP